MSTSPTSIRQNLLRWYDTHARDLPWRRPPGSTAAIDPYRVWLSEVMLQQTTTAHAAPYFHAFTARWPSVDDLARADDPEVMAAWAGLGYYARARNLKACARAVAGQHGGRFPCDEAQLRSLPGLGPYTAAAVAAIAFDAPAVVVDGNVERVISRLYAVEEPLPHAKDSLRALTAGLVAVGADGRHGDFAQAMMDLGATVCRPKAPVCAQCPVRSACQALAQGRPESFPVKLKKATIPQKYGLVFILRCGDAVLVETRPDRGLLGGMLGLPTSPWRDTPIAEDEAEVFAPTEAAWRIEGEVTHVFTHFRLRLTVVTAEAPSRGRHNTWHDRVRLQSALPTVFAKALKVGGEG